MKLVPTLCLLSIAAIAQAALAPNARKSAGFRMPSKAKAPRTSIIHSRIIGTVGVVFEPEEFTTNPGSFNPEDIAPASLLPAARVGLSPVEVWWLVKCEELYNQGLALKCPWMRRRMLDTVDTIEMVARSLIIQPNNLELVGPPIGLRGDAVTSIKQKGLSIEQVADIVRDDWKAESAKGYYVTGSITPSVYRDDCLFDGPDPDMPVKGLRKFRGAASQLFDRKKSTAELLSLEVQGDVIVARWRMNGVLRLPFRPKMPEVIGTTVYHLDENNLIYKHEETWQMSALEAFFKTDWFCRQEGSGHDSAEPTPYLQEEA